MISGIAVLAIAGLLGLPVWRHALARCKQGRPLVEPREAPPVSWGIAGFAAGLIAMVGVHILVGETARWAVSHSLAPEIATARAPGGISGVWLLRETEWPTLLIDLIATTARNLLILALLPLVLARFSSVPSSDLGLPRGALRRDLLCGLAVAAAMLLPVMLLNALALLVFPRPPHPVERVLEQLDALSFSVAIFSAAVAAPLAEEVTYRVFLQGSLERLSTPTGALVAAAAVFAAAHGPMWPDPVPLFVLALALGYLYRQRRSWPAVAVCHAAFNAFNLTIAIVSVTLAE